VRVRGLAVAAALVLAGCVPGTDPSAPADAGWERVTLPDGMVPSSLAAAPEGVLVGGRSAGPAPLLVQVAGVATTGEFVLAPRSPEAAAADLVGVAVSDDDVYALGSVISGAHSNPRLTVWDGSVSRARLTSRPQEFFTFGGHDAGPLLGTVVVDGRPVIVGTRVDARGPYALLWTRDGHAWAPRPAAPELASAPDRVLGFAAAAVSGDLVVVAGDELGLAGGLAQVPVVHAGTVAGRWSRASLPLPEPPAPGLARATSVACPQPGTACWVAGWGRGRPLAWPVTITAGALTPGEVVALPGEPAGGNDPTALVALADGRPLVLTNAAAPTLQQHCPDGWRTLPAPAGTASALVTTAGAAYAVAAQGLWRLAVPAC
jgi:hypothetical protein